MTHRKGPKQNNKNKRWNQEQRSRFKKLVKGNTPTPLIADALGRTVPAIQAKAQELNISLKPPNRSPYTRRKR